MAKKKDKKRKSKTLGRKEKNKLAKKAAKVIVNNSIIVKEFRNLFQMHEASDKKIKKHIVKMINRYNKYLDKKANDYIEDFVDDTYEPPKNPGLKNTDSDVKELMESL